MGLSNTFLRYIYKYVIEINGYKYNDYIAMATPLWYWIYAKDVTTVKETLTSEIGISYEDITNIIIFKYINEWNQQQLTQIYTY